jgi:tetratricopeptide (TPR) repeat protein
LGERGKVLEFCKRSLSVDPYHFAGYYVLAYTYGVRSNEKNNALFYISVAIETAKKVKHLKDKNLLSLSYRLRSQIHSNEYNHLKTNDLEMSLFHSPCKSQNQLIKKVDPHIWHDLGCNFYLKEDYQKSLFYFDKSVTFANHSELVDLKMFHYDRGKAYFQLSEYDKALEDFLT